ncbi:hypothetical protein [Ruficoccus sp. ZRK36]|uniref:hypothetical protein n=1 Tax=Ruficoccus sp. ZRK36 TaxID=2866311 RepID=UPI001C72F69F|nr:hypothetical protein [Ruficoccus sp. ZRK36]QYY35562.1 hypothetical protein K0V07_14845 [Ruficoccus sp. ZRK36]
MLDEAFESAGWSLEAGWHIACSRSLTYMLEDPEYTCVTPPEPYGAWPNALANYDWDAITFQSYPYGEATAQTEMEAVSVMIDMATADDRNQDCVFYLYVPWPSVSSVASWQSEWARPYTDPTAQIIKSEAYYEYLFAMMCEAYPELDIRMIPVGQVLAQLDQKLNEIPIPVLEDGEMATSVYDLYRDIYHMAGQGRYIAHRTVVSTLLGVEPSSFTIDSEVARVPLDQAYQALAQEVMWSVISNNQDTGVTESEPSIFFRQNTGTREIVYRGKLYQSTDLQNWSAVDSASPYRLEPTQTYFYRAAVVR